MTVTSDVTTHPDFAEHEVEDTEKSLYDAIVVGAGVTGLYQLKTLRDRGLSVLLLEAGSGVGGTWFWNRYPGCRLDSESFTYQYAFSDELLHETRWSEVFAGQPELERYYNDVADRFDLRSSIRFDTRVEAMDYDQQSRTWTLRAEAGAVFTTRMVVCCTGILSAPNYPAIEGMSRYRGELLHTALWPDREVDFTGKKVIVIGTGATGIQVIPQIARTAAELTVFQRTANWTVPLRNRPTTPAELDELESQYPAMFEKLRASTNGFVHDWDPVASSEVTDAERTARFEEAWQQPGFAKWFGMYHDIATDPVENQRYCDFIADKIRARVNDPATAAKLIPTDHLFGSRRVPCETNYFETYNQDNVELVTLAEEPILEFTETGVRTANRQIDADMIVLATGFDAFTGALAKISITGRDGVTLQEKWKEGPTTYMGLQVAGFPNMFIVGGPHGKGGHGNSPRCSEPIIEWLTELIAYASKNNLTEVQADPAAEKAWTEHVYDVAARGLVHAHKSYAFGDNVAGKAHVYVAYLGSLGDFVQRLRRIADDGYAGFELS